MNEENILPDVPKELIPPIPPRGRFDWFHAKPHAVQAALIGLLGTLVLAAGSGFTVVYTSHTKATKLEGELQTATKNLQAKQDVIQERDRKVQQLEFQLAPFRTIALQRYTAPEAEALKRLATQIDTLQQADDQKTERIRYLESELNDTQTLAETARLELKQFKAPRTIPQPQRTNLIKALSAFSEQEYTAVISSSGSDVARSGIC